MNIKTRATTIDLQELLGDNAINPVQYQYYKNLENRTIIINDEITQDIIEIALLPLMEMDTDGSGKPIVILLNSVGGDVYYGYTLIDYIEKLKTPTTIKILGLAASMGALIAMAGKNNLNVKTVCSPFSVGLIHSGSQYMTGTTHAVKDTFKFSERYEEKIKKYILSHTNIDEEMYLRIERQEFWMDSDDMLQYGIVSEIV